MSLYIEVVQHITILIHIVVIITIGCHRHQDITITITTIHIHHQEEGMDITIVHRQSLDITQVMEVMEDLRIQDLPLLHQDQVADIAQVQANQVVAVVDDKKKNNYFF
jgi:hypothetical protein